MSGDMSVGEERRCATCGTPLPDDDVLCPRPGCTGGESLAREVHVHGWLSNEYSGVEPKPRERGIEVAPTDGEDMECPKVALLLPLDPSPKEDR